MNWFSSNTQPPVFTRPSINMTLGSGTIQLENYCGTIDRINVNDSNASITAKFDPYLWYELQTLSAAHIYGQSGPTSNYKKEFIFTDKSGTMDIYFRGCVLTSISKTGSGWGGNVDIEFNFSFDHCTHDYDGKRAKVELRRKKLERVLKYDIV